MKIFKLLSHPVLCEFGSGSYYYVFNNVFVSLEIADWSVLYFLEMKGKLSSRLVALIRCGLGFPH
jgi:hypothetical protein